jgi:hypothetical protein
MLGVFNRRLARTAIERNEGSFEHGRVDIDPEYFQLIGSVRSG